MNCRAWSSIFVLFMIIVNSGVGSDTNQGSVSSPQTGTAIVAVNDFYLSGETSIPGSNLGHVAVLIENPKDHTYKFVSVQARGQNEPIKPEEIDGLTKEEAENKLKERGYTRFKTYEIKDPKYESADAEVDNLRKEKFELSTSAPLLAPFSHILQSAGSLEFPTFAYDNCFTGGIKILEKYGAKMPGIDPLKITTPKDYYEKLSGEEEEYTWSDTENKYVSTATDTPSKSSSDRSDLGGINFTSIKLNYISVSADQNNGINFDLGLKAKKAEGSNPGIDPINSTKLGAIAFVTGLAVPDDKFWVNLNTWEPDRIIDEQLRQSEVGRIMLEADLQMKKDYSNYENPCANETGKALVSLLDGKREALVRQCMDKYPGEIDSIDNVWFIPVTRHWIVPDKIYVYTNNTQIYIINSTLTIYSEPISDKSLFRLANQDRTTLSRGCLEELDKSAKEYSEYYKELGDQMILPYVIWDVNHGEKYEDLRNVYVALALAQWYKSSITATKDVFRDRLDSSNSALLISPRPWSAEEIWENYVFSFYNGEYKCWKNTTTETATGTIMKSALSTSGGVNFYSIRDHLIKIEGIPPEVQDQINKAVIDGSIDEGMQILFGNRLHLKSMNNTTFAGSDYQANAANLDPILALEWYNKGIALNDQGKYDEAIEAFDEAIRLNPNFALAWGNKGAALFSQGKYDEAIKACDEAIRLDPNYAYAWNNKGSALGMQHKYDDAIKAYDEAIRLDPNYADARNNKEEILKALGSNF